MFGRALTWPKLIGCAVGFFGVGAAVSAFGACLQLGLFSRPPDLVGPATWLTLSAGVLLFALSIPLYRSHDWARIVLFVISLLASTALLFFIFLFVLREPQMAIDGSFTAKELAGLRYAGWIEPRDQCRNLILSFRTTGLLHLGLTAFGCCPGLSASDCY